MSILFFLRFTVISARFSMYFKIITNLGLFFIVYAIILMFALFSFSKMASNTFALRIFSDSTFSILSTLLYFGKQDKGSTLNINRMFSIDAAILTVAALYLIFSINMLYLPVAFIHEEYRLIVLLED